MAGPILPDRNESLAFAGQAGRGEIPLILARHSEHIPLDYHYLVAIESQPGEWERIAIPSSTRLTADQLRTEAARVYFARKAAAAARRDKNGSDYYARLGTVYDIELVDFMSR